MADAKPSPKPKRPSPPLYLTRENAIENLKKMMPPPGYSEWGGGVAAGEPDKNIPGKGKGGAPGYSLSDEDNAAKPPAPPPYLSPMAPVGPQSTPNAVDLEDYHSPQNRPGYGEKGNKFDPMKNPGGFLSGQEYNAIPKSVPAPVKKYMGDNPAIQAALKPPARKKSPLYDHPRSA